MTKEVESVADRMAESDVRKLFTGNEQMNNEQFLILLGTDCGDLRGTGYSASDLIDLENKTPKLEKPYTKLIQSTQGCTVNFDMGQWHHSCKTTHSAAGWIVTHAGEAGAALESEFDTPAAARLILRKSCPDDWPLPDFYASNEAASAFIRHMAAKEAAR